MSKHFVWHCECKHPKNVHKVSDDDLDLQRRTGLPPYCRKCGASLLSYQRKQEAKGEKP